MIPRALLASGLAIALTGGCHGPGEHVRLELALDSARTCEALAAGVSARLSIPEQKIVCPLAREQTASGKLFSGVCDGVQPATKVRLMLEYFYAPAGGGSELQLARAQREITIDGSDETVIGFAPEDLSYAFDEDEDGLKNVDEVCLGRDPRRSDGPTFSADPPAHEPGALGSADQIYLVGERIRILGSDLPPPELVRVTVGPLLDGSDVNLTPLPGTSESQIEVQLPAGLDAAAKATLAVEALGVSASYPLAIGRVLVYGETVAPEVRLRVTRGSYPGPDSPAPRIVCIEPEGSGSTAGACAKSLGCGPYVDDISSDGRLAVVHCRAEPEPGLAYVIELPTATRWSPFRFDSVSSAARFVADDSHLALADPQGATMKLRRVDAGARAIAAAGTGIAVADLAAIAAGGPGRASVYAVSSRQGVASWLRRYDIKLEGGVGKLSGPAAEVKLEGSCPTGELSPCEPEGDRFLEAVDADRVVISRPGLDRVELVDLAANKLSASAAIPAPSWLALLPRSRDRLYVTSVKETTPQLPDKRPRAGVCALNLPDLGGGSCHYLDQEGAARGLTVPPEESLALLITDQIKATTQAFTFASAGFSAVALKATPSSILVQP